MKVYKWEDNDWDDGTATEQGNDGSDSGDTSNDGTQSSDEND